MERHRDESIYELLQHELYTPEEVARLLGISVHIVQHAAFTHELRAQIVGHDIMSIRREDVIAWFEQRYGTRRVER
jgi:excisionase family DNA binding protein